MMHEKDERLHVPNEKSHAYHSALLTTGVIFANWPILQSLLSPYAYLKDGVWNYVVSFAQDPVLVIAFEIDRHCTKMST